MWWGFVLTQTEERQESVLSPDPNSPWGLRLASRLLQNEGATQAALGWHALESASMRFKQQTPCSAGH